MNISLCIWYLAAQFVVVLCHSIFKLSYYFSPIFRRPTMAGWRAGVAKPTAIPGTPGVNLGVDEPDFRFPTRMIEDVADVVLSK